MAKEAIEKALALAVHHVIVEHVMSEYTAITKEPSLCDLPALKARVAEIYGPHK